MKAVLRLFLFLRASNTTFPTRKVALATNVSTSFALRGIISWSTVTLKLDESHAAIESGLCFDWFTMGFSNERAVTTVKARFIVLDSLLDNLLYSMELFRNRGMSRC
jgi:hypothetical protein